MRIPIFLAMLVILTAATSPATAQYSVISTPFNNLSDSFHESFGFGGGFSFGGNPAPPGSNNSQTSPISFGFPGPAPPPFGGFQPGTGATLGGAVRGGNFSGSGNFGFSQGNSRALVSQTPMVTVPNGGSGSFYDTSQRPFVTGVVPVIGGWNTGPLVTNSPFSGLGQLPPATISPLQERISRLRSGQQPLLLQQPEVRQPRAPRQASVAHSSAESGDLSVAEIRRQQDSGPAVSKETTHWIELARSAEQRGKQSVARLYYRNAANTADGALRQQLLDKVQELK
jgi:hypothetical protein